MKRYMVEHDQYGVVAVLVMLRPSGPDLRCKLSQSIDENAAVFDVTLQRAFQLHAQEYFIVRLVSTRIIGRDDGRGFRENLLQPGRVEAST